MPLIKCPECTREVSSLAPACPQCGCPLQQAVPQQVELTGKRYKAMQLVAALIIMMGLLSCGIGFSQGIRGFVIFAWIALPVGVWVGVTAGTLAWWYHR